MAEDKGAEPLSRSQEIPSDVFAGTDEVPCGFFSIRGDVDGGQRAGAIQHGQLRGVAPVRFDPVAGASWDESWGNDLTRDPARRKKPVELESARPGLVTAVDGPLLPDLVDEPPDVGQAWREWLDRGLARVGK